MRAVNLRYVRFVGRDCANFDEISEVLATPLPRRWPGSAAKLSSGNLGVADEIIAREGREDEIRDRSTEEHPLLGVYL